MRLWSVHPKYLDPQGLVALWREALLAQKVLQGRTKGYRNHPQLDRFKKQRHPQQSLAAYLSFVWQESKSRGYQFDQKKIGRRKSKKKIPVTVGQLKYEFNWLCRKLKKRSPQKFKLIAKTGPVTPHPLFRQIKGPVESWERIL